MNPKDTDLRRLLPQLERLPEVTREGLVKFLGLVLAVDRSLGEADSHFGELDLVSTRAWDEGAVRDFKELLSLLEQRLQGQQPVRRDLVLAVLAASGKAYELGEEATGRLLLQLAIVMTAGQESAASAEIQDIVCAAALALTK